MNIFFPGKQGVYLENGIRPPFLFYKLGNFFLQVSLTVSNNVMHFLMANLWLLSHVVLLELFCVAYW